MRFYYRFLYVTIFICSGLSGLIIGCKGTTNPLGHTGPFDNPTVTSTITNTPTVTNTQTVTNTPTNTSTPGPVNVSVVVNYQGTQNGINYNLVDPSGNTVGSSSTNNSNTPFSFNPSVYGTYSVNVPTQTRYLYSSIPITISGPGNYTATFTCSNQTLSANPSSLSYGSCVGCQIPVSITYSYTGNLRVPITVDPTSSSSAFSISPSSANITENNGSAALTISKSSCTTTNTSWNFVANDFLGNNAGFSVNTALNRGYSIPVSLIVSTFNSPVTITSISALANYSGSVTTSFSFNDSSFGCAPSTLTLSNPYSNVHFGSNFNIGNGATSYYLQGTSSCSNVFTFSNWLIGYSDIYVDWSLTLPTGTSYSGTFDFFKNSNETFNSPLSNDLIVNTTY